MGRRISKEFRSEESLHNISYQTLSAEVGQWPFLLSEWLLGSSYAASAALDPQRMWDQTTGY
jgi:hypothetical protein